MLFDILFGDNFFSFEKSTKESVSKQLEYLQSKVGGNVETTYEQLTKVTKTWQSDDGKSSQSFSYYISGENSDEIITKEKLQDELKTCIERQDFERCAEIRDELNKLE